MKKAPRGAGPGSLVSRHLSVPPICGTDVVRKMPFAIQSSAKLRSSSQILQIVR